MDSPGIVPRTIETLFKQALDSNHTFLITFSMLEIYLGNLKDLLVPQATRATDPLPPWSVNHYPNYHYVKMPADLDAEVFLCAAFQFKQIQREELELRTWFPSKLVTSTKL